jgi:cytochrome c oxidase subunit 2
MVRPTHGSHRTVRRLAPALAAAAAIAVALAPGPSAASPAERVIRVDVSMTGFRPSTIRVQRGERVTIELHSTDVVHGLYLDGYGLVVTADPGQPASLSFTADRAGTFRFRCSVTCGALHPFLVGRLVVASNALFWGAAAFAGLLAVLALWRPWR